MWWAVGRRFCWLGRVVVVGESRAGPSKGDGCLRLLLESSLSSVGRDGNGLFSSSLLRLVPLPTLEGDCGIPRLLVGRPNGLAGRSEVWPICDGRRTNGLAFSGDSEPCLAVGEKVLAAIAGLVGEWVGVVARRVAGEAEFWRLKGDWRPESKERGEGRMGVGC